MGNGGSRLAGPKKLRGKEEAVVLRSKEAAPFLNHSETFRDIPGTPNLETRDDSSPHFIGKQTEAWKLKGLKVSYFRSLGSTLSQNLGFKVSPFLAEAKDETRSGL